jgi:DNA-binding transcriptional LysR family regulator
MEPDRWLGVELRHLAALEAVADEGSFSRAAARLGYTQSAVSQQIATLERIVGEKLIERPGGPRPVSLTQAGSLLLRHAEVIVARLRAAQADLEVFSKGEAGSLRLGIYQSVGARLLPRILTEYRAAWPEVDIHLADPRTDDALLELLERGEIDLSFTVFLLPDGPFEGVELLPDHFVFLVQRGHPLATRRASPTLDEIGQLPLISFTRCRGSMHAEDQLRANGIEPNVVFRSDDNGTVTGLVAAGIGAALAPRMTVEPNAEGVAIRELRTLVPPRLLAIAWHRDRYRSPAATAFVDTAVTVCKELRQARPASLVPAAR